MISFENVTLSFSDKPLFKNISFRINKTDRICLVGANGSGKSTLLKLIAGLEHPDEGIISVNKGVKIGYLPQELTLKSNLSLFDEVRNSLKEIIEIEKEEKELNEQLQILTENSQAYEKALKSLGELNHRKERIDYYSANSKIEKTLKGLGFSEIDFNRPISQFSGGWSMRIEMAKILLNDNDILLLDEPTNHLDIDSLNWFVQYLNNFNKALLIVSHDKEFILRTTNKTLEIFNRKLNYFNGDYDKYLQYKKERLKSLIAQRKKQEQLIKETKKFIEKFRYKATKAKQVQSRIKMLEKLQLVEIENDLELINIKFPEPPKAPSILVQLNNVSKYFNNNCVFKNVSLNIEKGDRIAFVGPNGSGKTTLSRIIAGKLKADSGTVHLGNNILISYYSQEITENLNLNIDCLQTLSGINSDINESEIRTILGAFLFKGDDVFKKVSVLSGGEKSRLALAKILMEKSNLIILDEPTNHLDFNSKAALKNALLNYRGSLVIISHDIDFIRGVANKVLDLRNKQARLYYGGIDYYLSKQSQLNYLVNNRTNSKSSTLNKKSLKRLEAEKRQQKYRATKELKEKIKLIEKQINELENLKIKIEKELTAPEIFSNPLKAKEANIEYSRIKDMLDKKITTWAELNDKLEIIESQFN